MPLPRLSRLFRDAAKNLSAGASPVARVPVTPSAVFNFRVLCVSGFGSPARFVRPGRSCGMSRWILSGQTPNPTFSVEKTHGALSPPQQTNQGGPRGTPFASEVFATDHGSQVAGHRSPVAGLLRLRRVRRRQGPTGQRDESATGTQSTEMRRRHPGRIFGMFFFSAASASLRCNPSMPRKMKKYRLTPLERTLTRKRAVKSFRIHSYEIIGLKLPWNDILTKNTGGEGRVKKHSGEPRYPATLKLSTVGWFSCLLLPVVPTLPCFSRFLLAFNHRARLFGDFLRVLCACGTVQW